MAQRTIEELEQHMTKCVFNRTNLVDEFREYLKKEYTDEYTTELNDNYFDEIHPLICMFAEWMINRISN